jgi:hypothetical protein
MKNLEQELNRLLEEQIQHYAVSVCNIGAVKTFEDYHYLIGKIQGLKEAMELFDQAITEVNKSRGN